MTNPEFCKIANFHRVVEQSQRTMDYGLPSEFKTPMDSASNAPSTKKILYTQRALHTYEDVCKIENVKISKKSIF